MLVTPTLVQFAVFEKNGITREQFDRFSPKLIQEGVFSTPGFNGTYSFVERFNQFSDIKQYGDQSEYGVCDSVEQVLEYHKGAISDPNRKFIILLTRVDAEPENAGNGGGWRWHKWGPYIGTQNPQCEYLDDEDGIDFIYCFHLHEYQ